MAVDIVRGMLNVPLAKTGVSEADHLGKRIAAKGGVDSIVSSPMGRAQQTVAAILKHNPQARNEGLRPGLRPFAQGGLEGHQMKHVEGALKHYSDNPQLPVPGMGMSGVPGESVDAVNQRNGQEVKELLGSLKPGERKLAVAHHTQIRFLRGWKKKGFPPSMESDPKEMGGEASDIQPAKTLVRLAKRQGKPFLHEDDVNSDEPIRPGLSFVTHGATELNKESGGTGGIMKRLRK